MKKEVDNSQDVIDSRDIISRIEELEEEKEEFIVNESSIPEEKSPSWGEVAESQGDEESKWDETEEGEELKALLAVQEEAEGYCPDWKYGASLIRESFFTQYCKDLTKEIGGLPKEIPGYIENNINWDGVAEDLQADYTSVDFDGVTYWVR
jgi:hypothetical protein